MTFAEAGYLQSVQFMVDKLSGKSFLNYLIKAPFVLFSPREGKDDLTQIIYLLGKRMRYSVNDVLQMDGELRDDIYNLEKQLVEHEQKESKTNK